MYKEPKLIHTGVVAKAFSYICGYMTPSTTRQHAVWFWFFYTSWISLGNNKTKTWFYSEIDHQICSLNIQPDFVTLIPVSQMSLKLRCKALISYFLPSISRSRSWLGTLRWSYQEQIMLEQPDCLLPVIYKLWWLVAWMTGELFHLVSLDFSEVFDVFSHSSLIDKLGKYRLEKFWGDLGIPHMLPGY